jgi:hypothetical protein
MRTIGKHCKRCKKYKNIEELNKLKIPEHCQLFFDKKCRKQKKIEKWLKDYFPHCNLDPHLYENIAEASLIDIKQVIKDTQELFYWSIRFYICEVGIELVQKPEDRIKRSKEIWRCKTEEEALEIVDFLNDFNYYLIPIEEKGRVFSEKVYL